MPQHFLHVVQLALREFFNSIQAGKDTEASWKKQIYKVIRHTDQESIPEKMLTPELVVGYYTRLACVDLDLKDFKSPKRISFKEMCFLIKYWRDLVVQNY